MKQGQQKSKGNQYEIRIARIFSKWYCKNFKGKGTYISNNYDYFWRTAGSGAKATTSRRGETSFIGDITLLTRPDALRIWIDTKNRKDITLNNILIGKFKAEQWYKDELNKMKNLKIKKPVVIIFTLYRKKEDYIFYLKRDFTFNQLSFNWDGNFVVWKCYAIMKLEDFLNQVTREEIISNGS